jgi:uncharacterized coiled-coil protein SlyX
MSRQLYVADTALSDVDSRLRRMEERVAKLEQHLARLEDAVDKVNKRTAPPDVLAPEASA